MPPASPAPLIPRPTPPVDDTVPVSVQAATLRRLEALLPGSEGGAWVWPGTPTCVEVDVDRDGRVSGRFTCLPAASVAALLGALTPPPVPDLATA